MGGREGGQKSEAQVKECSPPASSAQVGALCSAAPPLASDSSPPDPPFTHTQVLVSLAACAAFVAIGFPTIVHFAGWFGLVKYWLMPWLGYHFWMSTFTVIHRISLSSPRTSGTPQRRSSPAPCTATSLAGEREAVALYF